MSCVCVWADWTDRKCSETGFAGAKGRAISDPRRANNLNFGSWERGQGRWENQARVQLLELTDGVQLDAFSSRTQSTSHNEAGDAHGRLGWNGVACKQLGIFEQLEFLKQTWTGGGKRVLGGGREKLAHTRLWDGRTGGATGGEVFVSLGRRG